MAWLLGLKEIRDVTGFSNPERRVALMRGEIDAIAVSDSGLLDRQAEWSSISMSSLQFQEKINTRSFPI
jgi:hypothetical protein